jgi:hypothetical protein
MIVLMTVLMCWKWVDDCVDDCAWYVLMTGDSNSISAGTAWVFCGDSGDTVTIVTGDAGDRGNRVTDARVGIERASGDEKSLGFTWNCEFCGLQNNYDLLSVQLWWKCSNLGHETSKETACIKEHKRRSKSYFTLRHLFSVVFHRFFFFLIFFSWLNVGFKSRQFGGFVTLFGLGCGSEWERICECLGVIVCNHCKWNIDFTKSGTLFKKTNWYFPCVKNAADNAEYCKSPVTGLSCN